ncbi:uncharacterized protein LOC126272953 isoform X4 [Schistocerca gregaria]|uniref:uncharacterized protein LOC126272953 isoform X4 n=2 Tax=Schistocerca gregaria TaxID=7010 RepID=UPI00211E2066|nr:uncharacterized protein LOC126272953 isoform X4 [Schistocerca gregaria]
MGTSSGRHAGAETPASLEEKGSWPRLTAEEYSRLADVLRRDASLRRRDRLRLRKLREQSGAGGREGQLCERCGGGVGGGSGGGGVQRSDGARCDDCGRPVCADCAAWRWRAADPGSGSGEPGHWLCARCHAHREVRQQTGDWWKQQASRRFRTAARSANSAAIDDDNGLGMEPESLQVREFIEKLVEKLVHGGLDDVCVGKLHSHPDYKPLPEEDSPTAAHAALKKLIHKIIGEAMTLPPMQQVDVRKAAMPENYSTEDEMALKTYEDILATAILNKVIEKYQAHRFHNGSAIDGNSNILSSSYSTVSMEQQTKYISSLEIGVKKVDDESISSKDVSESDSDEVQWKKSELTDPSLSLTIEERIEEVTTYSNSECEDDNGDSDEKLFVPDLKLLQRRVPFPEFGMDIVEGEATGNNEDGNDNFSDSSTDHKPTDIVSPVESWEENWLFQRRRLKAGGASTQMPVPMLVPNPSEEFRALIGDRDAEDISDLSECSDSALEETVLAGVEDDEDKQHEDAQVIRNNVQLPVLADIGETSDFDILKEESIEIKSHGNNSSELLIRITGPEDEEGSSTLDADLDIREATNLELMKASIDCSSEFGQKDSEYTEDYDAVTRRQIDSLTNLSEPESTTPPVPKPRSMVPNDEPSNIDAEEPLAESDDAVTSSVVDEETSALAAPPRPGTIAEREHKKWETAPPLPNNPYSPENISKRLSNRMKLSSSQSSSSEASVEFPDLQDENMVPRPIAEPLHIVCAPQDLDFKRYGRDYYVNSKTPEPEKKSQPPSRHMAREQTPRNNTSQVNDVSIAQAREPISETKKALEAQCETNNTAMETSVSVKEEAPHNNTEKVPVSDRKSSVNYESDPEIPAPGTVISEIARWQSVINETEQLWMKNAEAVMSDNSNNLHKIENVKNDSKSRSINTKKSEMKPKIAEIYLQEISKTKTKEDLNGKTVNNVETYEDDINSLRQNRIVKTKVSSMNRQESSNTHSTQKDVGEAYIQEINSLRQNGGIKNKISNVSVSDNNNINGTRGLDNTVEVKHKIHETAGTFVQHNDNTKQNGNVKMRTGAHNYQINISSNPKENKVTSETPQQTIQNGHSKRNVKPVPKPRTEGNIDIVHLKTNISETVSHIEIVNKSPEITVSTASDNSESDVNNTFRQAMKERHLHSSCKQDTMSVTSEGSINSSDSEVYNLLPSVKRLAKQFQGMHESDSSASSVKCPSPVPMWNRTDGKLKTASTPERLTPDATPPMEGPMSGRHNLSPNHATREVHSLTARSISREFREGLKRNLPAQMDRNLYTHGHDSSQSPPRSIQRNSVIRQEDDSTPGYTSDDSSFLSSSPPNELQVEQKTISVSMPSLNETPRAKTLQSSIAFWEQLQHK